MTTSIVKNQHYIPRFYLRKFSQINNDKDDKKNKIKVFDKKSKKIYGSSVANIGSENYFYNIDNAQTIEEKQVIEKAFSDLESNYSVLLNKFINRCKEKSNYFNALITTKKEREEFSMYIFIQLIRTKKYREIQLSQHRFIVDNVLNAYKEYSKKHKGQEFNFTISEEQYKKNSKLIHLQTLVDNEFISKLTSYIADSTWMFIYNETNIPFIISDNPVCRAPRYQESINKEGIEITSFISEKLDISFPLSPNLAISIFRSDTPHYEKFKKYKNRLVPALKEDHIHSINKIQCLMAYEKIFINSQYESLLKGYCSDKFITKQNLIF